MTNRKLVPSELTKKFQTKFRTLKELLDSSAIGSIVSIQHLESVGFWHQAHSFVRGNWGNETSSATMLLAKILHDLDWIRPLIGQPCTAIGSFDNLSHFRKEKNRFGSVTRNAVLSVHTSPNVAIPPGNFISTICSPIAAKNPAFRLRQVTTD